MASATNEQTSNPERPGAGQYSSDPPSDLENSESQHKEKLEAQHEEDVHIEWTFRRMVAIASLCLVYVGEIMSKVQLAST